MLPATIIIVEDDSGTRRTLCGILGDAGYQVIEVARATDALETVQKSPCDLVITDIRLPDASGIEVLKQLKEIKPDVVVIIMTGYASVETAVAAVEHGAYAYFIKPVNPDELTINIANALKQQRLVRENKRLLDDLQHTNKKLLKAAKELHNEVTEHRGTEQALQESEAKLNSIFQSTTDQITVMDKDLNILWTNEKLKKIFGDDIIGKKCYQAYFGRKEPCKPYPCLTLKTFEDGKVHEQEIKVTGRDGKPIYFHCIANVALRNKEGKPTAVIEILRNITEVREMAEALRKSEGKLNSMLRSIADQMSMMDRGLNILWANETAKRIFGDDIIGKKCYQVYHKRQKPCNECPTLRAFQDGEVHEHETQVLDKDGNQIYFQCTANVALRDKEGKPSAVIEIARDITERRRAEEALTNEAIRRRILIEQSRDGIVILDQNGKVYESNRRFTEMLGYSPEEMLQLHAWDWDTQWTPEQLLDMIRSVGEAGDHFETYHRRKDGTTYDVEISTNGVIFAGQRLVFCVCRDITDRRRAEKALKGSEERYRSLVNNVKLGILRSTLGPPGRIIEVNPALEEITGYSRDELLAMDMEDLYVSLEERRALMEELAAAKGTVTWELHWRRMDGGEIVVLDTVITVRDSSSQVLHFDAIIEDITEHRQAEEALRDSEEKYRTLVENATDFIYMTDAHNRILSLNQSAARFFGKKPEELVGKKVFDIFPLEMATRFTEEFRLAFETGKTIMADTQISAGGTEIWVSTNLSPIRNDSGEVVAVMGVTRDITEQKRMERALQEKNEQLDTQNEELRVQSEELVAQQEELLESTEETARANQLKSEFLANMSHELRTPLNTIIGFSQLMRDEAPGKLNQEQKQCLDDVLESSQHLLHLINEVLDLSKIEAGRAELKLENVTLAELITPLTRSMMPILGPKKQNLDLEIEEGLPPVRIDKVKLGQVFRNLLANSSKFTPEGGKLWIEATSADGWLQLSVIDNGIGIKKQDQERIFEPFCQLDYTPSDGKSGTGLGLAVVKQIVERHGGQIRVESEYGRGCRFTISLPLATK